MMKNFFTCLLKDNCDYSIKKILSYVFSILVIYLVIFTDKSYYDILIFIGGLLGVRAFEKSKGVGGGSLLSRKPETKEKSNEKEIL